MSLPASDVAADAVAEVRSFAGKFRREGMAWQGAYRDMGAFLDAALELARLYEERTDHLEDVIEERGRYYDELKRLRYHS
jgi:hypothetical protein